MCIIFKDRCWVVYITFVGMVKFKFPAHFPVDHLAHLVMSSFVLLLLLLAVVVVGVAVNNHSMWVFHNSLSCRCFIGGWVSDLPKSFLFSRRPHLFCEPFSLEFVFFFYGYPFPTAFFSNPFKIVPHAPTTFNITFFFFYRLQARSNRLSHFALSFIIYVNRG